MAPLSIQVLSLSHLYTFHLTRTFFFVFPLSSEYPNLPAIFTTWSHRLSTIENNQQQIIITCKIGWRSKNEPCTPWPIFTSIGFWLMPPPSLPPSALPPSFTPTPAYSGWTDREKKRRPSDLHVFNSCTVSRPTPSTDSEHTLLRIYLYVCVWVNVCLHAFWVTKQEANHHYWNLCFWWLLILEC